MGFGFEPVVGLLLMAALFFTPLYFVVKAAVAAGIRTALPHVARQPPVEREPRRDP